MKKIFAVFLSIIGLLFLGAIVFIATFNVNRYKPIIIERIEKSLNARAEIGSLSLSFSNGLSIDVNGLKIFAKEAAEHPGLQIRKASASVEIAPLLKKQVNISSVLVSEPSFIVNREADGSFNLGGVSLAQKSSETAVAKQDPANAPSAFSFLIRSVQVKKGTVLFNDRSGSNPAQIKVEKINITLRDFSLDKLFSFTTDAALFSDEQNFKIEGKFKLPTSSGPAILREVYAKTDLKDLDLIKIAAALPTIGEALPKEPLAGVLEIRIPHYSLDPQESQSAHIDLRLKNARVVLPRVQKTIDQLNVEANLESGNLNLKSLSANFAGGQVRAEGQIAQVFVKPFTRVHAFLQELVIDELMQTVSPQAPRLSGHVSVEFEGEARGLTWPEISATLNGNGHIVMRDGVLLNYNLLREIVQKLSIIPGAETILQNNFPQAYRRSLDENSTILHPLELNTQVRNGIFLFNPLLLQTDLIAIAGAGQVGLDKSIVADANLTMSPDLSVALAQVLNPLQILLNERNEIFMPLHIEGVLPQVRAIPDRQYLTSKLLGGGAQQILQNLIQKPKEGSEAGADRLSGLLGKITGAGSE